MRLKNEKYIVCIETTSEVCGVSIGLDNKIIYSSNLNLGLNHSITLFENINNALSSLKIDMANVSKIKVSSGPGSFTGIRIGIACALGLSTPYNTKIEYVDTLDSLSFFIDKGLVCSLIDARVDRVYFSMYYNHKKLIKDIIININDLIYLLNKHFKNISLNLVGSGAIYYKKNFDGALKVDYKIYEDNIISSDNLLFAKGKISKTPIINYLLSSKAEREKYG